MTKNSLFRGINVNSEKYFDQNTDHQALVMQILAESEPNQNYTPADRLNSPRILSARRVSVIKAGIGTTESK